MTRRNRLSCSLCPLLCRESNTGRRFCDEVRNGLRLRASEEITCSSFWTNSSSRQGTGTYARIGVLTIGLR